MKKLFTFMLLLSLAIQPLYSASTHEKALEASRKLLAKKENKECLETGKCSPAQKDALEIARNFNAGKPESEIKKAVKAFFQEIAACSITGHVWKTLKGSVRALYTKKWSAIKEEWKKLHHFDEKHNPEALPYICAMFSLPLDVLVATALIGSVYGIYLLTPMGIRGSKKSKFKKDVTANVFKHSKVDEFYNRFIDLLANTKNINDIINHLKNYKNFLIEGIATEVFNRIYDSGQHDLILTEEEKQKMIKSIADPRIFSSFKNDLIRKLATQVRHQKNRDIFPYAFYSRNRATLWEEIENNIGGSIQKPPYFIVGVGAVEKAAARKNLPLSDDEIELLFTIGSTTVKAKVAEMSAKKK